MFLIYVEIYGQQLTANCESIIYRLVYFYGIGP